MKYIKLLSVLALFFTVVLFQSCEDDACEGVTCLNDGICLDGTCDCSTGYSGADCGTHCSEDIIGTWDITSGMSANCNLVSYTLAAGATDRKILITITDDGGIMASGTGTLSFDCSTMTYELPNLFTGNMTFTGNTLTDVISIGGCEFGATKQ